MLFHSKRTWLNSNRTYKNNNFNIHRYHYKFQKQFSKTITCVVVHSNFVSFHKNVQTFYRHRDKIITIEYFCLCFKTNILEGEKCSLNRVVQKFISCILGIWIVFQIDFVFFRRQTSCIKYEICPLPKKNLFQFIAYSNE